MILAKPLGVTVTSGKPHAVSSHSTPTNPSRCTLDTDILDESVKLSW